VRLSTDQGQGDAADDDARAHDVKEDRPIEPSNRLAQTQADQV
jgi:hypothetical protein